MMVSPSLANAVLNRSRLMACNVYFSVGAPSSCPPLMDLLTRTQQRCLQPTTPLSQRPEQDICLVVHAFTDVVYHRTSFHLAGSEEKLTSVVSHLVHDAQQMFSLSQQDPQQQPQEERHDHPQVGLIDHIAVMPLLIQKNRTDNDTSGSADKPEKANDDHKAFVPASPWGRAARAIGNSILLRQQQGQDEARPTIKTRVLFYGDADCHQTSLAEVRRNKTTFFNPSLPLLLHHILSMRVVWVLHPNLSRITIFV